MIEDCTARLLAPGKSLIKNEQRYRCPTCRASLAATYGQFRAATNHRLVIMCPTCQHDVRHINDKTL